MSYGTAQPSVDLALELAGCDTENPQTRPDYDLLRSIEGNETSITYWSGCDNDTAVEFWTMNDGPHIPSGWSPDGMDIMVNWAIEHPRN